MSSKALYQSGRLAWAGGLGLITASSGALGSGFALPEISVAGVGTANALVANPREVGAIAYNPAAMAFHERSSLSAGALFFSPNLKVTTASGEHDSQSEDTVFIPALQGALRLDERWSLGLGLNSQFGLETNWELGTFPALSVPIPTGVSGVSLPAGLFHPAQSKLELVTATPTVTYRVNENLGASLGLDYYHLRTVSFDTHAVRIKGDEGDGWGWNLGLMYNQGPWTVAANYHSSLTVKGSGEYRVLNPILTLMGMTTQAVEADLNLPWRTQLGIRYAFTDQLAAELDYTRTGWSEFDTVAFTSKDTGQVAAASVNNWQDANAYRLGLTYDVTLDTQLRLGYTLDETGQSDGHFSARIPDSDRQLFGIGLAHQLSDGWQLEAGYMYVLFDDNAYHGEHVFNPAADRDPNGSTALQGDYEADVHIIALGLSKRF